MANKDIMKTYIIRIYRYRKRDPKFLVGTVEEIGSHGKKAFSNRDELWEIMNYGKIGTGETYETKEKAMGKKLKKLHN